MWSLTVAVHTHLLAGNKAVARNWYLLATEANLVALHLLTIILAKFRRNCAASPSS